MSTFASRLASAMKEKGIGPRALERLSGITNSNIVKLRKGSRGKRPSKETVAKLARALEVAEDWLADGIGPRERTPNLADTSFERAARRAEKRGVAAEAIEQVRASPQADESDEETLFQLMIFAGHQIKSRIRPKAHGDL